MLVNLADLKPFALRDFRVDPIDPAHVGLLTASINEFGLWPGYILIRSTPHGLEIVDGHHLRCAALAATPPVTTAEIDVREISDEQALLIYARVSSRPSSDTARRKPTNDGWA
jgi:hypothetical protein